MPACCDYNNLVFTQESLITSEVRESNYGSEEIQSLNNIT